MHDDASNEIAAGEADKTAALPDRNPPADGSDRAAEVLEAAAARFAERFSRIDPWDEYREGGDLVIEEQPMTAIYANTVGAIVIRQLDAEGDTDNDPLVRFLPHYAPTVIRKIAKLAGYHVLISREPIPAPAAGRAPSPTQSVGEPNLFGEGR